MRSTSPEPYHGLHRTTLSTGFLKTLTAGYPHGHLRPFYHNRRATSNSSSASASTTSLFHLTACVPTISSSVRTLNYRHHHSSSTFLGVLDVLKPHFSRNAVLRNPSSTVDPKVRNPPSARSERAVIVYLLILDGTEVHPTCHLTLLPIYFLPQPSPSSPSRCPPPFHQLPNFPLVQIFKPFQPSNLPLFHSSTLRNFSRHQTFAPSHDIKPSRLLSSTRQYSSRLIQHLPFFFQYPNLPICSSAHQPNLHSQSSSN